MRRRSPLPEGYWVDEADGYLRLFSPQGILIQEEPRGPGAAPVLEAHAWRDAWEQVEHELKEELHALREGIRPLYDLRRLRQYMRMLDAMVEVPPAKADRPDRSVAVAWLALAASAAAIVVVLLTTPLRVARGPEPGQHAIGPGPSAGAPTAGLVVSTPAAKPAVRPPLPERVQGRPLARPSGTLQRSARAPRPAAPASGRPASAGYAVGFGEFASHAAAEITMHFVRGKGYLVYVTRTGDAFQVATRPYRTRAQAERLASALQAIGLPARTFVAVTPVL